MSKTNENEVLTTKEIKPIITETKKTEILNGMVVSSRVGAVVKSVKASTKMGIVRYLSLVEIPDIWYDYLTTKYACQVKTFAEWEEVVYYELHRIITQ